MNIVKQHLCPFQIHREAKLQSDVFADFPIIVQHLNMVDHTGNVQGRCSFKGFREIAAVLQRSNKLFPAVHEAVIPQVAPNRQCSLYGCTAHGNAGHDQLLIIEPCLKGVYRFHGHILVGSIGEDVAVRYIGMDADDVMVGFSVASEIIGHIPLCSEPLRRCHQGQRHHRPHIRIVFQAVVRSTVIVAGTSTAK